MTFPRTMAALAPLMDLRPTEHGFVVDTLPSPHGAIYGSLELLQHVLVAERAEPGKRVLSLHTSFISGGRSGEPAEITVEFHQRGRSFANATLTMSQRGALISRATALMSADEPDFLRSQSPAPRRVPGERWTEQETGLWPGPVWAAPPHGTGEVELRLGVRGVVPDAGVGRALTAMATEAPVMSALIATIEGPWQFAQGSSNVLTHTVTLLEPVGTQDAVIVSALPAYAGRGRAHGSGRVTDDDGRLLATFQTTGVLRAPRPPSSEEQNPRA
jgi:acyl-CoA thioesterase-2